MFTVTFVLYEQDDLDRSEALRSWRDTHGPLVAQVPGVQQHAVGAPDGAPPFLGVASLSFADQEAFGAAAATAAFADAVADVANVADAQRLPTAFVEDVVIVG